jgi:dihydrofolate synthase/folylpolyglutamate synthase
VAKAAVALGCDEVLAFDTVEQGCAAALKIADGDDAILATGSLYVAGAARPTLLRLAP